MSSNFVPASPLAKAASSADDAMKMRDRSEDGSLCRYKFGKCLNPRTFKINGTLHSLCAMHRQRQNAHQLKSDRKRRQRKSLQTTPSSTPASKSETSALISPPITPDPFLDDYAIRSSAIGEAIYCINYNLIKLTQLLIRQEELARTETCSGLLSLNPANFVPLPPFTAGIAGLDGARSSLDMEVNATAESTFDVSNLFEKASTVAPYSPRPSTDLPVALPPFSSFVGALSSHPTPHHSIVM